MYICCRFLPHTHFYPDITDTVGAFFVTFLLSITWKMNQTNEATGPSKATVEPTVYILYGADFRDCSHGVKVSFLDLPYFFVIYFFLLFAFFGGARG